MQTERRVLTLSWTFSTSTRCPCYTVWTRRSRNISLACEAGNPRRAHSATVRDVILQFARKGQTDGRADGHLSPD